MIYLKEFENQAAYEAAKEGLLTPNVSLITDTSKVKYLKGVIPPTPTNPIVTCTYIVSESGETSVCSESFITQVEAMKLDGTPIEKTNAIEMESGEHTVEFTLNPNGIITNDAFYGNEYLASVNIQGNTLIEDGGTDEAAFSECGNLASVVIGNEVTRIGDAAFYYCENLSSCTIGNGVTSIGYSAFDDTPWWDAYSADTSHHYGNIVYINDVAYRAVDSDITSVTFKNDTKSIGGQAFYGCWKLSSVTIPNSVTNIGYGAFELCSSLESVTVNATTPPALGGNAFYDAYHDLSIYVPSTSVDAYKAASGWSNYSSKIKPIQ